MSKSINYYFTGLLFLTLLAAILSTILSPSQTTLIIVSISLLKFWLVSFQFMDLKKAHIFWKSLNVIFGITVGSILYLFLK